MTPTTSYDAVVIGTGIAGLATALALTREGVRTALLGPKRPLAEATADAYDPRVYAISPASRDFLARLGVWGAMPAQRVSPVSGMEVYGDRGSVLRLDALQAGRAELAYIVESTEVERALRAALQVFGVPWIEANFAGLMRRVDSTDLELITNTNQRMAARLVVGADGANSPLRSAAGIDVRRREYAATGLVIHLDAELPHGGTAFQWFTPLGILALLPMPATSSGPQVSMVWSLQRALATELLALPRDALHPRLISMLQEATQGRLGNLTPRSQLHGFRLSLQTARTMAADGIALVGDAAHVVHPLAGQGLNLGLGDAAALAAAVGKRETWRQPGDARVLRRYQRARAEPVVAMQFATDGLYQLFNVALPPVAWLRNTGMALVDRLPFAKRFLIERASSF